MAFLSQETVSLTTAADGSGTAYSAVYNGLIHSIQYVKPGSNAYTDGVVITVTAETSGLPIWSETLSTNASKTRYPRAATHDVLGAASLYAAAGQPVTEQIPLAGERIKIVIASGGNAKVATFTFVLRDCAAHGASASVGAVA